ncbi:MAG: 2-amino-4-hydroxy-6-hydroxymethyldihydropteridine diphosphokinase [Chthoniobacterales bacterium]
MRTGIALGTNLGDRLANLRLGRDAVLAQPGISGPALFSGVYETAPVDCAPGTPSYLNAVMEVEYHGHVAALLDALQAIERQMGRPDKRPRNASRPIDLDILYCGNLTLNNEEVIIPHPRLHQRRFVLEPLAEIAPEKILPGKNVSIADLLTSLPPDTEIHSLGVRL